MRKKTHIELAKNLLSNYDNKDDAIIREKSFYIGSILPDCVPSFLIKRHNIDDTFYKLNSISNELLRINEDSRAFWRKLGCILHYIADYFTLPHNNIFVGNIKAHCRYERQLKMKFSDYLKYHSFLRNNNFKVFSSLAELWNYLKSKHENYIKEAIHTIETDIFYIYNMCCIVFQTIFLLKI